MGSLNLRVRPGYDTVENPAPIAVSKQLGYVDAGCAGSDPAFRPARGIRFRRASRLSMAPLQVTACILRHGIATTLA
jgi:hypothetical protein